MTNTYEAVNIPASTNPGPTLEESYEALKADGMIAGEEPDEAVAQGGAEGTKGDDTVGEDTDTERPSWLPDEFSTVEEFRAAYDAMKNGDADEGGDDDAAPEATAEERAAAEEAATKAGLDLSMISDEYWANDGLSTETYAALAKAGYPQELVEVYIEGLVSRTTSTEKEVYSMVGSKESYGEMIEFAFENMTPAQQTAYDREINSGNKTRVMNAVKALKADFEGHSRANNSVEPEVTIEPRGGTPKGDLYLHLDDYMSDLNDPRYEKSEGYRQKVHAKLARSRIL